MNIANKTVLITGANRGIGRALVEQALTMVFSREALGEPFREAPGLPAVEMKDGALGDVLADAVPVERRLAADVQPLELSLQ